MRRNERGKKGFTLVEVIVVLVILAILAAIMIPAMTGWIARAEEKAAYAEIHTVVLAARSAYAEVYALDPDFDPTGYYIYAEGADPSVFGTLVEEYINDPEILSHIESVTVVAHSNNLFVFYVKDGIGYNYSNSNGTVSITNYEP